MKGKRYNNFLNIVLGIVIIAIIGVLIYIGYEYFYLKNKINADANEILAEFDKYMNTKNNQTEEDEVQQENQVSEQNQVQNGTTSSGNISYSNINYGLTYKGYGVLGKIELPKVGLQYPILETMTNANAIDVSVAVQYGVRIKSNRKQCYCWSQL